MAIDGFAQVCNYSIPNALELPQSFIKPSMLPESVVQCILSWLYWVHVRNPVNQGAILTLNVRGLS